MTNYKELLLNMVLMFSNFSYICSITNGGLAQLARACDWQSQGREFDSPNLHGDNETVIKL